jgi:hypothetical protein
MPIGGAVVSPSFATPSLSALPTAPVVVPLNGAQITSAQEILLAVSSGTIAPIAAAGLLVAVGVSEQIAQRMVTAQQAVNLDNAVALPKPIDAVQTDKAISDVDTTPTNEMAELAARGLELRREFGRGGTEVGVARARDISNMATLSPRTVSRMNSFFARHRVDLDATGARSGQEGYPSAGAIAWMLWGGDPNNPDGAGAGWASRKAEELAAEGKDKIGDFEHEEKMLNAQVKIASLEAKAWDAVHQQPKIDALQAELAEMRQRTQSLDEIVTMLTEALGDDV